MLEELEVFCIILGRYKLVHPKGTMVVR